MLYVQEQPILLIGGCGYLGSALYNSLIQDGYNVDSVDLEWYGEYTNEKNRKIDYRSLTTQDLDNYKSIILLVGHPNATSCNKRPLEAYENNVTGFLQLLNHLKDQRLIYASSVKVYSGSGGFQASEDRDQFSITNMYNFTKFCMDGLAQLTEKNYYGLRLGEVNGPSPNMRIDQTLNHMVQTAMQKGRIDVYKPEIQIPILGMEDFCKVIKALLSATDATGIYNISSFNTTHLKIGQTVADMLNVPMYVRNGCPSYSLSVKTKKFEETFQFRFQDILESVIQSIINSKFISYYGKRAA